MGMSLPCAFNRSQLAGFACQGASRSRSCAELPVDAGCDGVDAGDGLDGAGDGVVEVLGRGSLVRASEGQVGPELVERDPGVEEFGLQAAEGVVFSISV
jgi:hypothetical protein